MADTTIPQLQEAAAEDVNDEFVLPVDSGTETYKLKLSNLVAFFKTIANFVTSAMITDGAVTTGKIGNSQVTEAKIANGAVTTAKIGDSQVTGAKIASNTITAGNIAANAVGNSELASNAVMNVNVASNAAIAGSKIQAAGASNAGVITSGTQTLGGTKTWAGRQYYDFRYHTFQGYDGGPAAIGRLENGQVFVQSGGVSDTGNAFGIYGTNEVFLARFRDNGSSSAAFRCDGIYSDMSSSGANIGITSSGNFYRSTSSARFKREIEDADKQYYRKVLDLRPVFYRAKGTRDADLNWSYWGFIAEEVAEIEPRLVQWGIPDDDDDSPGKGKTPEERKAMAKPDGVDYGRVAVLLQAVVRDHDAEIKALQDEIKTLKSRLSKEVENGR